MKPKIYILTFSLIINLVSFSQTPNFQWAKSIGGYSYESALDIATDALNNIYTTGTFQSTVDFDPGIGIYTLTATGGSTLSLGNDVFISKLDADGNFVWAKQFVGSTLNEKSYGISTDVSGNVYVTGHFDGIVDFDPGAGTYTLGSTGYNDIFITKLDVNGNFVWAKQIGGPSDNVTYSIAVDLLGNVYTTGYFEDVTDFDTGIGTYTLTPNGIIDVFISKLDANGNFLWAKQFGGTVVDMGMNIKLDASNNVYTTGYFRGTSDFDPGPGTYTITSKGLDDVFILKLDAIGNFIWAKQLGGTSNDNCNGITIDGSYNVYSVGYFSGAADFDPGAGTYNLTSTGTDDMFISKLDASGNFVWAKKLGGSLSDGISGITLDGLSNIYTTGYFQGTVDFNPSLGIYNLTSFGSYDIFVSKFDASGNFVWANQMGGTSDDFGSEIAIDASNNIYTTGSFKSTSDFDPSSAVFSLTSVGNSDAFVQKMGQCSVPVTTTLIAQSNALCSGQATGSATISASGGNPYTYNWSPIGGSSAIATGLSAGLYSCVVTNSCGATATQTVLITQPNAIITSTSVTNVLCFGNSTGAATITTSGGSSPYTYLWSTAATTSFITGQIAGVKTVTVTDANSCTTTNAVAISQPSSSLTATSSQTNITCITSGGASVVANGGSSGYTYNWSPTGGNTASAINLSATNYTCTIQDANLCITTKVFAITANTVTPTISITGNSLICDGQNTILTVSGANTYTWNTASNSASINVSPTLTTAYSASGTNTVNGCTGADTFTLIVNPTPTITVNSGTICSGNSFTIIPSGASTYTYSSGSAIVSPTTNASYTISGTDLNGCSNNVTTTVTVNSLPTLSVSSSNTLICTGQSAILIATGANTYTWSTATVASSITVTPTATTVYSLTATDSNGCTNTVSITQQVSVCTEIKSSLSILNKLNIYPNPSHDGIFTIELPVSETIYIYDILGNVVYNTFLESGTQTISLHHQSNGIYILKSIINNKQQIIKLIKQ